MPDTKLADPGNSKIARASVSRCLSASPSKGADLVIDLNDFQSDSELHDSEQSDDDFEFLQLAILEQNFAKIAHWFDM